MRESEAVKKLIFISEEICEGIEDGYEFLPKGYFAKELRIVLSRIEAERRANRKPKRAKP